MTERLALLWLLAVALWLVVSVDQVGGRPLVVLWSTDPEVYDPHATSHPVAESVFRRACETLWRETADGELTPVLAADAPRWSTDGRELYVEPEAGRRFHSGRPVTAEGVAASFNRLKRLGVSPLANQFRDIEVRAEGDRVVFTLPEPNYEFPRLVLSNSYAAVVNPDRPAGSLPDCTGPYRFDPGLYVPGERISLRADSGAESGSGSPADLPELRFVFIDDGEARLRSLVEGDGCVLSVDAEERAALETTGSFEFLEALGGVSYVGFNMQKPRWQDPAVRRGIAHAIDKAELAAGGPFLVARTPLSPSASGYAETVAEVEIGHDPETARRLLSNAGFDFASEVTLLVPESSTYAGLADTLEKQLAAVGLRNIRRSVLPREQILTQRREFDLLLFDYAWSDFTALGIFLGPGPRNLLGYSGADVPDLVQAALRESDPSARQAGIESVQRLVLERALWQPVLIRKLVFAVNQECVEGVRQGPFGELDFSEANTAG